MVVAFLLLLVGSAPTLVSAQTAACNAVIEGPTVVPSNPVVSSRGDYTITVVRSRSQECPLLTSSFVTIEFPEGTDTSTVTTGTMNGTRIGFSERSGRTLRFVSPISVATGGTITIVLSGVTNPAVAGPRALTLSVAGPSASLNITLRSREYLITLSPCNSPEQFIGVGLSISTACSARAGLELTTSPECARLAICSLTSPAEAKDRSD